MYFEQRRKKFASGKGLLDGFQRRTVDAQD